MSLKIDNVSVKNWASGGSQIYEWNTKGGPDGSHNIALTVEDKAGNSEQIVLATFVDNARPTIEAPAWKPKEPSFDIQVNVTVEVSDPQPSSGILNVTLWYKNTTMDDWQPLSLSLDAGVNWTGSVIGQSLETTVKFYIEAFDKAGNKAISDDLYEYNVIAPAGLPLAWIIAVILLILAATAAAIYFWRKRRTRQRIGGPGGSYKLTVLLCF